MDEEQDALEEAVEDNIEESSEMELDEIIEDESELEEYEYEDEPLNKKAAMVITIESWATPLVGILTLVLGLALGYFGRPLISDRLGVTEPTAIVVSENVPAQVESEPIPTQAAPQLEPEEIAARQQALMDAILPRVRHFKGSPDAPITMIEFSDFQ